jgi:predicted dienelactone hydrolase
MRGVAASGVAIALALAGCGGGLPTVSRPRTAATHSTAATTTAAATPAAPARAARPRTPTPPFAVGERVLTLVDHSRTVQFPGEARAPRTLMTIVRYPAVGRPGGGDIDGARPLRAAGPYPLVIFGHGFAVTPAIYAPLLHAWARAGYVVAAPVFPLGNANAPGGPNESDLVNQPADMSFVITRMLTASAAPAGPFSGLIDARHIAVSGQSDGGDTALASGYNEHFHDRRIGAAMILSGQEIPGVAGYDYPAPSPPLLATQGLADTINVPSTTYAFFDPAPAPKYLLTLPGAPHLPPYTSEQPQLSIVERVTIAFLDRYLKGDRGALARMRSVADRPGIAALQADP